MTSNEEDKNILLLNEIEKVYERELERKKTLESKATNVITVSGIMVTLLFGFSAFLFQAGFDSLLLFHISIFASVLSAIIALWLSLYSLKITGYSYVFGEDPKCNVHLDDIIEQYKTFPKDKTIARITDSYVVAITENSRFNDDNAKRVRKSQRWLFVSLLIIAIMIGLTLLPLVISAFYRLMF